MPHNTPLSYHFKHWHIWLDMALLALLFVLASYVPLLKIVPLIACLELFSFFSYHLLPSGSRFQLQGFLGGFISSTAVFLQVLNQRKFAASSQVDLLKALLLAVCAMLLECMFIISMLAEQLTVLLYVPFLSQLLLLALVVVYLNVTADPRFARQLNDSGQDVDIELLNDHPIVWKNVLKLSLLIFGLIWLMHFIGSQFGLSPAISTLIVSLFEAHAVLASVMTQWRLDPSAMQPLPLLLIILLGNTLSKSYLVYKGSNLRLKGWTIGVLVGGFLLSVAASWLGVMWLGQD